MRGMNRPLLALVVAWSACAPPDPFDTVDASNDGGVARFDVDGAFWDAPFPSDHRVREDTRRVDLSDFPNPNAVPFVDSLLGMLDGVSQGFARTGGIVIPFDRPIATAQLPTLAGSVKADATVFLMDVDADSPDPGRLYPIEVATRDVVSDLDPAHAVVALPLQGVPLPERRRLALVVRRTVMDADGGLLTTAPAIEAILAGETPAGWRADVAEQYLDAVEVLRDQGVDTDAVAGLTVFTTGAPTKGWAAMVATAREAAMGLAGTITRTEVWPDYCVYESRVSFPFYQHGTSPFATEGGGFVWEGDTLVRNPDELQQIGRIVFTVPRVPTVDDKRPTVVFIRTGAGGDRPLIDRSPHTTAGVDVPGEGYAATFARRGWAAVQVDGPLGGPLRNPGGADEQFLLFNVQNPVAMRDNLRQSALELALLPDFLDGFGLPTTPPWDCPGIEPNAARAIRFDTDNLVLFGHSMGATIAPLAAAGDPRYRALILSGAGGSWIENVVHKTLPLAVAPIAATMLSQPVEDIDEFNPVLTLLQWAGEAADPPLYAPSLVRADKASEARHVLMYQGLFDHYIPPPVANALSLALGLDVAGEVLDEALAPEHAGFLSLARFTDGEARVLPAGLNVTHEGRKLTALLVQQEEDGIEDGHEVVFQNDTPHHQIGCFLEGVRADQPLVPGPGREGDPCADPPQAP